MKDSQHRYLIIDDDPGDIEILSRLLKKISDGGSEVESFTDPASALAVVESGNFGIIFVDYLMGAQTGLEVYRSIRELGCKRPVVMLTGQGSESIAVKAIQAGGADYVVKESLGAYMLDRVIRNVLSRFDLEQELENQRKQLEELSRTDGLTGLANRRHFMDFVNDHIQLASRHGSALSVLMIDLDHFKDVNDTHGHLVGDRVLEGAAEVIRSVVRTTDLAGRYGGEEFCITLPQTDIGGAELLAERIRISLAEVKFKSSDGEEFQVTCSIGGAQIPKEGGAPDTLLDRADRALYQAKESGRNKVSLSLNEM